jgi:hypothetical protein
MAIGDQAGLKAVEELNAVTIPALVAAINALVDKIDRLLDEDRKDFINDVHGVVDRINGISISIPARKP